MIRKLLATTAIATLVATGAMAQSTTTPAPATTTEPAADAAPVERADGHLATNLIGENVYNGTADDAETIGNVNDLVIGADGNVESIVVGVGGFLGIGEKNVAVAYDDLDWAERDGDRWIVVTTTADALRELPAFDRRAYDPAPAAGTAADTTAPAADTGMASNTTTTPVAPVAPGAADTTASDTTAAPATTGDTAAAPATTDTDTATTSAVDRESLTEVPAGELSAEELNGTTVYGAEDANVGEIGDVILSEDGQVDAVIVDVGGFLGIGEKQVAIGMDNLAFMQDADGNKYLYTEFTEDQLEAQPAYDEGNWTAQRDQMRMSVDN